MKDPHFLDSNRAQPRQWQPGSAKGFGEIYDHFAPRIWRHIFLRTSSRDDTNDLTSRVFLKTWEYCRARKKIRNIQSFLYKTADNLVIDWYRSRAANRLHTLPQDPDEDPVVDPVSVVDVAQTVSQRYDAALIRQALNELEDNERAALIMRFIDDLSIIEVADALGKSKGATSVAIHRALKSLEKIIRERYGSSL